jgi:hypothetical protein
MGAWAKEQKTDDKVMMLGDGNGEFTQAMGLTMDASRAGLGSRSQRYAMIVDDGVIDELLVEKPGAFAASAAENVQKHLQERLPPLARRGAGHASPQAGARPCVTNGRFRSSSSSCWTRDLFDPGGSVGRTRAVAGGEYCALLLRRRRRRR